MATTGRGGAILKILGPDVWGTILYDNNDADASRRSGLMAEEGEVLTYATVRVGTLQCLPRKGLADKHDLGVAFSRSLLGILYLSLSPSEEEEERIICKFNDGSMAGPCGLVVGCDGSLFLICNRTLCWIKSWFTA